MTIAIQESIPLAPLTTFQIGGAARYFVEASNEEQIREAIAWAQEQEVGFIILAGGSNVLIQDEGVDGLVIHLIGNDFARENTTLDCNAGCDLLHLILVMAEEGLGGWEKLAGIPGTVGGAVRGNAGAFGTEIQDLVGEVLALHNETNVVRIFKSNECNFSYRNSFFKQHPEWIILRTRIELKKMCAVDSKTLIEQTVAEREKRHLQNIRAAGSFFMNPIAPQSVREQFEKEKNTQSREGRVPAGWLIEKVRMKGKRIGGAQSSTQHANYIINTGNATSNDVCTLAEQVKMTVKKQFAVDLQEEAYVVPRRLRSDI